MVSWLEEKIEQVENIKGFHLILTTDQDANYRITLTNGNNFHLELSPYEKLSQQECLGLMQHIKTTDSFLKLANYYRREEKFDA